LSLALQVLVVHVPLLNDAFDTEPLSAGQWGLCVALSSVVLVVGEVWKAGLRRWAPSRTA
jgi:P-type Ca2+ transporter type 2C